MTAFNTLLKESSIDPSYLIIIPFVIYLCRSYI